MRDHQSLPSFEKASYILAQKQTAVMGAHFNTRAKYNFKTKYCCISKLLITLYYPILKSSKLSGQLMSFATLCALKLSTIVFFFSFWNIRA